jgi:hypothetical protein
MQMARVERMILGPSRCFLCGRTDGPAIDTRIQRPAPTGHVYICMTSCLPAMVELVGGLSPNAAAELMRHGAAKAAELEALKAEILRLRPFEQAVANARASSF